MAPIKTSGINIRSVKVGEADKIITILSRDLGKISAIAKGARKPTSRFGGRLEVFAYNEYLLGEGRSLYVVSQVETIESFWDIRKSEDVLLAASYIMRLIDAGIEPEHRNPALFDLLLLCLHGFGEGIAPHTIRKMFEVRLMEIEGFFPHLMGCVKCKKKVVKEPTDVAFNPILGGLTCSSCTRIIAGGITIPFRLIKLILQMKTGKLEELKELNIEQKDIDRLDLLVKPYISDHIGKDIRNW